MAAASKIHQSHPAIVKRLKRVAGHLRSVVAMIEEQRPCADIAQQLHAVEKAIAQAKILEACGTTPRSSEVRRGPRARDAAISGSTG